MHNGYGYLGTALKEANVLFLFVKKQGKTNPDPLDGMRMTDSSVGRHSCAGR
jgi:hypothetical protein